jgi:uncharacterized protein YjbJ (UPF0337 family)
VCEPRSEGTATPHGATPCAQIQIDRFYRPRGEIQMKASTENEIAGKVHEVKGKIKETVGRVANDPGLEGEGIGEKIGGKIQKNIGQVQKVVETP